VVLRDRLRVRQHGAPRAGKGRLLPVPPTDTLGDIRNAMCLALEQQGVEVEVHHHEVGAMGQNEIGTRFAPLVQRADWMQILKYTVWNTAASYGKTCDLHAEARRRRQRLGHALPPVRVEGRQQPFRRQSLRRVVRVRAVLHRRNHQAREDAERDHEPGYQLVQAPGAWFEAPINLAYSAKNRSAACRIPYVSSPKARRVEVRFPDPTANAYLAFAAMLMAGLDGVQNKIHPGDPIDKDMYHLPPEEAKNVPHVCASLEEALGHLDENRAFLTKGGVFDDDIIDAYIGLKNDELTRFRMTTHPVEFDMYYSS
jgi:glutamine synthetase